MKKGNIIYSALWLVLLALMTSCIFDEVDAVVENIVPQDPVHVTFRLDVISSAASTRADYFDWDDGYDKHIGNSFENRINTQDLLILAYNTDGTFAAELPIVHRVTDDDGNVEFMCIFPDELAESKPGSMKFMVLANCLNSGYRLSYNGLVPNIEALMYAIPTQISSWAAIPMWGVKTYSFAYNADGNMRENQDLGTIDVLRSTAKVGVKLSDEVASKYALGGLKINRVAGSGYSVPNGWNGAAQTSYLIHDNCFRQVTGDNSTITNVAKFMTATDGTQYTYVPETANSADSEIAIALTLTEKNPAEGKAPEVLTFDYTSGLKFRPYTGGAPSGSPYNIVRNHYYEYTIDKIELGKPLELTLTVKPWDVQTETIKFTDEVSVNEADKMSWSGTKVRPGTSDPSSIFIDGASTPADAAVATFKINTPVGATWYASMEGDKDAFSFIVETTSGDSNRLPGTTQKTENGVTTTVYWKKVTSVTGNVGEPSVLRIITNAPTVSENKAVSLKIAVITMDGRTIMANAELMPTELSSKEYFMIRQNLTL